jgi:hypothetical protein
MSQSSSPKIDSMGILWITTMQIGFGMINQAGNLYFQALPVWHLWLTPHTLQILPVHQALKVKCISSSKILLEHQVKHQSEVK